MLGLKAKKRIFFSASFRRKHLDFDFGIRTAVEAGVVRALCHHGGWKCCKAPILHRLQFSLGWQLLL